ncbi:hypothetical protein KA005_65230 [bacterium]|nr:hypothetical protein [bacterium]
MVVLRISDCFHNQWKNLFGVYWACVETVIGDKVTICMQANPGQTCPSGEQQTINRGEAVRFGDNRFRVIVADIGEGWCVIFVSDAPGECPIWDPASCARYGEDCELGPECSDYGSSGIPGWTPEQWEACREKCEGPREEPPYEPPIEPPYEPPIEPPYEPPIEPPYEPPIEPPLDEEDDILMYIALFAIAYIIFSNG